MATININVGKNDIVNINVASTQQVTNDNESIEPLYRKLRADLSKYNSDMYEKEHNHWWYEVFVDFDEDFDEFIYPKIKDMDYEEQYTFCLGYMYRRDAYYFSPNYYNDMNEMVKNAFQDNE
jgi:hypothetical protein